MGVGDLHLELRVTLGEAFGDDVIHKTIAVHKSVSRLAASEACRGGGLVDAHGPHE